MEVICLETPTLVLLYIQMYPHISHYQVTNRFNHRPTLSAMSRNVSPILF